MDSEVDDYTKHWIKQGEVEIDPLSEWIKSTRRVYIVKDKFPKFEVGLKWILIVFPYLLFVSLYNIIELIKYEFWKTLNIS